jgi:hypothetical protein
VPTPDVNSSDLALRTSIAAPPELKYHEAKNAFDKTLRKKLKKVLRMRGEEDVRCLSATSTQSILQQTTADKLKSKCRGQK